MSVVLILGDSVQLSVTAACVAAGNLGKMFFVIIIVLGFEYLIIPTKIPLSSPKT